MQTALLEADREVPSLSQLLLPDVLVDGGYPEQRVVFCGISWERYLAVDRAYGDDRSEPRLFYFNGELEIVTTSNEHERIQRIVSFFMDEFFAREEIETCPRGQATLRLEKAAGAEPDDAWCIGREKEFPDIVFEVALTSGGVPKLKVYRSLSIPEVWIWQKGSLHIYRLREDKTGYDSQDSSRYAPALDLSLLSRCVEIGNWNEARKAVRAVLGT